MAKERFKWEIEFEAYDREDAGNAVADARRAVVEVLKEAEMRLVRDKLTDAVSGDRVWVP